MGLFFDWEKGDIGFTLSDDVGMKDNGDLVFRVGDHFGMDAKTGDISLISGWKKNKDRNEKDED